ncbi:MAG: methylated-DNA--[protein]-cysteine S-methyltransferase [Methanobacteriaceae archaeon]
MYYYTIYKSPIGELTIASDTVDNDNSNSDYSIKNNIIGLWIDGQKYHGNSRNIKMLKKDDLPIFETTKNWLDRYFKRKKPDISELPLAPIGTEFRQEVWKILCEIPYGNVISYGDISKEIAAKMNKETMSSQAVGGAVGHNPISIIIPCHRVVGLNGSLTGYAGGINRKIQLLELEGIDISDFSIPK